MKSVVVPSLQSHRIYLCVITYVCCLMSVLDCGLSATGQRQMAIDLRWIWATGLLIRYSSSDSGRAKAAVFFWNLSDNIYSNDRLRAERQECLHFRNAAVWWLWPITFYTLPRNTNEHFEWVFGAAANKFDCHTDEAAAVRYQIEQRYSKWKTCTWLKFVINVVGYFLVFGLAVGTAPHEPLLDSTSISRVYCVKHSIICLGRQLTCTRTDVMIYSGRNGDFRWTAFIIEEHTPSQVTRSAQYAIRQNNTCAAVFQPFLFMSKHWLHCTRHIIRFERHNAWFRQSSHAARATAYFYSQNASMSLYYIVDAGPFHVGRLCHCCRTIVSCHFWCSVHHRCLFSGTN